jgi:hypothetical protein
VRDYAIIGAKKRGKTTTAKALVAQLQQEIIAAGGRPLPLLVFDKNNEWGAPGPLPTMEGFLNHVQRKGLQRTGAIAVFEDAGIFFSSRGRSEQLLDILTAARHTRITSILMFHSLSQVPQYVWIHLDAVVIHKTKDDPDYVRLDFRRRPDILQAWERVNDAEWIHTSETVAIE